MSERDRPSAPERLDKVFEQLRDVETPMQVDPVEYDQVRKEAETLIADLSTSASGPLSERISELRNRIDELDRRLAEDTPPE